MIEEREARFDGIIDLLSSTKQVSVNKIADELNLSSMTIRRYLNELEQRGIVKRVHGGAVLVESDNSYHMSEDFEKNSNEKSCIGRASAKLIEAGEMIFLDSGSTTPYIARNVDRDLPLSVLCYTLKNAIELYQRKNTQLILAGGFYDKNSNGFHSMESLEMIKNLRADKAFISAGGIDLDLGLTTQFYFEAEIKKAMIAAAKQVILVVDSTKFGKLSTTFFANVKDFNTIITDKGISDDYIDTIYKFGIELIVAE